MREVVWFVWLGVSYVLPFHCILFSVDVLGGDKLFFFTVAYFFPCLLSSAWLVARPLSSEATLFVTCFAYGAFFLCLTFFALLLFGSSVSMWLLLLLVGVAGGVDGIAQSSVLSLAAHDARHIRLVLVGNAAAGLSVSALKILVKGALVSNSRLAAVIFTLICAALMLITMFALFYFRSRTSAEDSAVTFSFDDIVVG
jgi:hypothetical protein